MYYTKSLKNEGFRDSKTKQERQEAQDTGELEVPYLEMKHVFS